MARRLLALVVVSVLAGVPLGTLACAWACAADDMAMAGHTCEAMDMASARITAADDCGDHAVASVLTIAAPSTNADTAAAPVLAIVPAPVAAAPGMDIAPTARGADPPGMRRSPLLRL